MLNLRRSTTLGQLKGLVVLVSLLVACSQVEPVGNESATDSLNSTSSTQNPITLEGIPPSSVVVGNNYLFQPAIATGSGNMVFSIRGQPVWASFEPDTGLLSGIPSVSNIGLSADITITASNGSTTGSVGPFTILVEPASLAAPPSTAALLIRGTPPASVLSGQPYSFQPITTSASGRVLMFSIVNCPSWASFSTVTGALTGSPSSAQVGTYVNITISVSDGINATSLPTFSITVTSITTGAAELQWAAPTMNTNGTALVDLAGYLVYFGTAPSTLTQTITISNASATSYVVNGLVAGTWYFAVQAYDSQGNRSALSNIVSKTF
jgi:Putative Ig domain